MPSDKAIEQKAHSIVSEFGPRWWNEHARQFPNSKLSEAELRDDMARYCARAALEALARLIAAKEQAEKERDSFRRTLDERWEADKKAFAAIMRAAGRTHGVPPNKEVVAYFVEQNEALTARLRSMCEAMEPFAKLHVSRFMSDGLKYEFRIDAADIRRAQGTLRSLLDEPDKDQKQ